MLLRTLSAKASETHDQIRTAVAASSEVKQLQKLSGRATFRPIKTPDPQSRTLSSSSALVEMSPESRPVELQKRAPASQTELNSLIQHNRKVLKSLYRTRTTSGDWIAINCTQTSPQTLQSVLGTRVRVLDAWAPDLGDLSQRGDSIVVVYDAPSASQRRQPSAASREISELPPICAHGKDALKTVQFNSNSSLIEAGK